ncbi:MAG: hypothetical protein FWG56_07355 [Desulfovibrionaceae bacterium]|jgi:hypothetical protein|nr:hypothetical protein [Desulfovibrionaceae bacterium]
MATHNALRAFESYLFSDEFKRDADAAVADAIAESRALGLPVEGYLFDLSQSTGPAVDIKVECSQIGGV